VHGSGVSYYILVNIVDVDSRPGAEVCASHQIDNVLINMCKEVVYFDRIPSAKNTSILHSHSASLALSLALGFAIVVPQAVYAENQNDVARSDVLGQAPAQKLDIPTPKASFRITKMGERDATIVFTHWNAKGDRWRESYQVDAGEGGNVRLAVINRMVSIIRRIFTGDFKWVSSRLGRQVELSARTEDDTALKAFLEKEFFGDDSQIK